MSFYKGKKVLVAGGAGLVGTNLIKRLLPTGAKIRAIYHQRMPALLPELPYDRLQYIYSDLTNPDLCKLAADGMDYVFMCAAMLGGAGVIAKDPIDMFYPNVLISCQMLEASYRAGVKKYLTFGSTTSYRESSMALSEDEMWDGEPYEKYYMIGWHKRIEEKMCQIYSKAGMPCLVLRPSNVYGPYDNFDPATSHVAPALIRKVVERHDPLEVWGKGDEIRDLIYVDDLIDAVLLAMEKVNSYDPINIGLGKSYSVKEILWTILDIENYHPSIIFDESKPTMIPKRYVDISKAERVLGWKPKTELKEGIRKTIEWYRKERK